VSALQEITQRRNLGAWVPGEKPPVRYRLGVPHTLCWEMETDPGREGYQELFAEYERLTAGKPRLEVGYPWGGRALPGSHVLDLYDPRPDVDFRIDACKMEGIEDATYAAVLCCSVLEHIPRFWEAAAEIERATAPGGYIWAAVPTVWSFHPEGLDDGPNFGGDYWRMTHQGLVSLFGKCRAIAAFYIGPAPSDYPGAGWGAVYLGERLPDG
jgi:SAM-dependent methyltransferase